MSQLAEEMLRFIPDAYVKSQLVLDIDELHSCMEDELWKSSMILIGSSIEAVLYHHISQTAVLRDNISNFEKRNDVALANLLMWSKQYGVIDEQLYKLSEPIREYRNLIHARVQERLKTEMSGHLVQIGYNLLLEIVRKINQSYEKNFSATARTKVDELVKRVRGKSADASDFLVYCPIIERYGVDVGSVIVERNLINGGRDG